ncbi:unnamed protein product [Prorocentrum cordatum]|uniref:Cytochrome c-553 n=1 Tax=Prorocentrum cordatum TaxID=2364126 RepID=A0ABN9WCD3_9DINO|nr:unnamed protein product [Polarella glacialis]
MSGDGLQDRPEESKIHMHNHTYMYIVVYQYTHMGPVPCLGFLRSTPRLYAASWLHVLARVLASVPRQRHAFQLCVCCAPRRRATGPPYIAAPRVREGPPPGGGSPRGREASAAAPGWAAGAVLRAAALALAVGVAASAAAARAAGEGAPASVGSGAGVFVGNCAACHAGGSTVMQPDKGLRKEALVKYGMYDAGMIVDLVKSGKNAMPAFGERLGEAEITDVAAYVLSQADRGWP